MKDIIEKLHPLERKVLPYLEEGISYSNIVKKSSMKDIEVMRAIQWLSNKKLVSLNKTEKEMIDLDVNGKKYTKEGLPEKRLLSILSTKDFKSAGEIIKEANLDPQEFGVSIGTLKKKVAIVTENRNKELYIKRSPQGDKILEKESLEEIFKKQISIRKRIIKR